VNKNDIEIGKNRTGIDLSPVEKRLLIEAAETAVPSMEGDETMLEETRAEYLDEGETIGSMPPPLTVQGATFTMREAVTSSQTSMLLDRLGERLAFERTGVRLYAALIGKLDASDPPPGGPSHAELEKIQREEAEHFTMLRDAILMLGADPTALTPAADAAAVSSMGLLQVVGDPRMTIAQSLDAILVAELVDNDSWILLCALTRAVGHERIARRFDRALAEEQRHLAAIRMWVKRATLT